MWHLAQINYANVHNVTSATGIKKVVDTFSKVTGKPCGCEERRDSLNRKYPFKK